METAPEKFARAKKPARPARAAVRAGAIALWQARRKKGCELCEPGKF